MRGTIQHMVARSRAKGIAIIGYGSAVVGIVLYTQLGRIVDLRLGDHVLDAVVISSFASTFGGLLTAIVGSAIWARRTPTRQPLKIAVLVGVGSLLLCLAVDVNVHGPSAMLMFLVPFSVVNVLSVLVASRW
jgi:hypothetical protein